MEANHTVRSTCPYCGVGCQVLLNIKDNQIFRVDAPFDAAPNYGRLCVKGRFGTDYLHHEGRLNKPLIRKIFANAWQPYSSEVSAGLASIDLGGSSGPGSQPVTRASLASWSGQYHYQCMRQSDQ